MFTTVRITACTKTKCPYYQGTVVVYIILHQSWDVDKESGCPHFNTFLLVFQLQVIATNHYKYCTGIIANAAHVIVAAGYSHHLSSLAQSEIYPCEGSGH